jgi:hypothetical protein
MVLIIQKNSSIKQVKEKLLSIQKKKGFNAKKFLGKVNTWGKSGIDYQKEIRNEW